MARGPNVFSGGLDVPHLMTLERDALQAAWQDFFDAALAIACSPVPIVAAIAGHAPAGGCVLALCCDYRVMARSADPEKPYRIGLNEVQVGLAVPEAIQHLMRRVIGTYRAERLLVSGAMPDSAQALALGLVDEVVADSQVTPRALAWLDALLRLPSTPMLATRALARADMVAALSDPARIDLPRFFAGWYHPETQAALHALLARLGK
jgi:enoyl-CoA hydratase/carnithine racemase